MAANNSSSSCEKLLNRYEKVMSKEVSLINGILVTALTVPTIVFNLLVLVILVRTPAYQKPSFFILIGLALSDVCVGLVANPLMISSQVALWTHNVSLFCVTRTGFSIASAVLSAMSLLTTTLAAADRYLAVILHLRYQQMITKRRVVAAMATVWLVAGIPGLLIGLRLSTSARAPLFISMISLCIIITFFSYTRIYKEVKRQASSMIQQEMEPTEQSGPTKRRKSSQANCHKMNMCMFFVFCALILCYAPLLCLWAIRLALQGWTKEMILALEFAQTLILADSMLNPLIYCWRLKSIRTEVRKLLRQFSESSRESIKRENVNTALKSVSDKLLRETPL